MDTGSARSRFTIYGQRVFLGMLCYGLCYRNIHKLFTGTIFSDMDAYYLLEIKLYTHQVDLISTGRYYDDVNITNGTIILNLLYTRHANDKFVIRCRHLQYMYIFRVPGHASHQSTYLITLVPFV